MLASAISFRLYSVLGSVQHIGALKKDEMNLEVKHILYVISMLYLL